MKIYRQDFDKTKPIEAMKMNRAKNKAAAKKTWKAVRELDKIVAEQEDKQALAPPTHPTWQALDDVKPGYSVMKSFGVVPELMVVKVSICDDGVNFLNRTVYATDFTRIHPLIAQQSLFQKIKE